MIVRLRKAALEDSLRAYYWYWLDDPARGQTFRASLRDAVALVGEYPHIGSPREDGTRRVLLTGYPYVIVYRVGARSITVLAIRHTSGRPRSWR